MYFIYDYFNARPILLITILDKHFELHFGDKNYQLIVYIMENFIQFQNETFTYNTYTLLFLIPMINSIETSPDNALITIKNRLTSDEHVEGGRALQVSVVNEGDCIVEVAVQLHAVQHYGSFFGDVVQSKIWK